MMPILLRRELMGSDNTDYFDVLKQNGRTFWLASFFLDRATSDSAARLYKFCRVLDDVADFELSDAELRLTSLRAFFSRDPSNDLAISSEDNPLVELIRPLNFDGRVISAMVDGFLWDLKHEPFESQAQLIRYCYYVAGVVGVLMSDVLGCKKETAGRYHAIDLGIAMQLTNISRDVLEDAEMGRRYIPASPAPDKLVQRQGSTEIESAIARAIELSEDYYKSGLEGIKYLPRRVRPCVYIMAVLYRAISRKLLRNNLNWQSGRTILSRLEIAGLILSSVPACLWLTIKPFVGGTQKRHQSDLHKALEGLPEVNS